MHPPRLVALVMVTLSLPAAGLALLCTFASARAQSEIAGWGTRVFNSVWLNESFASVTAGGFHTVALRGDGSVVAWGANFYGQCNVPSLPGGLTYVEVGAAGAIDEEGHTVARRSDGSIVAWGMNSHGQCNVPALPAGLTYVEVAAGYRHTVARRSDGSVVAWGDTSNGKCNVPALPAGLTYVGITAGGSHTIGLRSDGTAIGCGTNSSVPALPAGSLSRGRRRQSVHGCPAQRRFRHPLGFGREQRAFAPSRSYLRWPGRR